MSWIYLILAGLFEVGWAILLKDANFSNIPTLLMLALSMALSIFFLALAVRVLPLAIAYAIWTGIGIVGTTLFSSLSQNRLSFYDIIFIGFILTGALGIKIFHE